MPKTTIITTNFDFYKVPRGMEHIFCTLCFPGYYLEHNSAPRYENWVCLPITQNEMSRKWELGVFSIYHRHGLLFFVNNFKSTPIVYSSSLVEIDDIARNLFDISKNEDFLDFVIQYRDYSITDSLRKQVYDIASKTDIRTAFYRLEMYCSGIKTDEIYYLPKNKIAEIEKERFMFDILSATSTKELSDTLQKYLDSYSIEKIRSIVKNFIELILLCSASPEKIHMKKSLSLKLRNKICALVSRHIPDSILEVTAYHSRIAPLIEKPDNAFVFLFSLCYTITGPALLKTGSLRIR